MADWSSRATFHGVAWSKPGEAWAVGNGDDLDPGGVIQRFNGVTFDQSVFAPGQLSESLFGVTFAWRAEVARNPGTAPRLIK